MTWQGGSLEVLHDEVLVGPKYVDGIGIWDHQNRSLCRYVEKKGSQSAAEH